MFGSHILTSIFSHSFLNFLHFLIITSQARGIFPSLLLKSRDCTSYRCEVRVSTEPRCHESLSSASTQHSHTLPSLKHPHTRKPIGFPYSEEDLLFESGTKQAKQFSKLHCIRMFIQSTLRILRILGTHICDNNLHIRKNIHM